MAKKFIRMNHKLKTVGWFLMKIEKDWGKQVWSDGIVSKDVGHFEIQLAKIYNHLVIMHILGLNFENLQICKVN